MGIKEIKKRMLKFHDFYGGDLPNTDEIEAAKTKQELADILERHRNHMESMLSDANSHLDRFKKEVGLSMIF